MEAYDPSRNMWLKLADMVSPCSGLGACSLFGLLYTVSLASRNSHLLPLLYFHIVLIVFVFFFLFEIFVVHFSLSQKEKEKCVQK